MRIAMKEEEKDLDDAGRCAAYLMGIGLIVAICIALLVKVLG